MTEPTKPNGPTVERVCLICNCVLAPGQQKTNIRQRTGPEQRPDDPLLGEAHVTCTQQQVINNLGLEVERLTNLVVTILVSLGGSVRIHKSHAHEALNLGNEFTATPEPDDHHLLSVKRLIIRPPPGSVPPNLKVLR